MPLRPTHESHNHREDDDEDGTGIMMGAPCFVNKPIARLHNFYLNGRIGEARAYVQWFEIIRNAKENETVYIHINSEGGDMFTTLQLIRAMNESQATIVASVEGMCMSAATLIFLTAQRVEISDHSLFMFHNYSGAVIGKGNEMHNQIVAMKSWGENLMRKVYENFLTAEEINELLNGKDLWLDCNEIVARLKKKSEALKAARELEEKAKNVPVLVTVPSSSPAILAHEPTKRKRKGGSKISVSATSE
jgi:ATP-dependent protease ClpP protease subunit